MFRIDTLLAAAVLSIVSCLPIVQAGDLHDRFFYAVAKDDVERLPRFFEDELSINPHARDGQGRTALHIAFEHDAFRAARYLIETRRGDINARDRVGWTPLHAALSRPATPLDLIERMLREGADPRVRSDHGLTPLEVLAQSAAVHPLVDETKKLALLLKHGARVGEGCALWYAVRTSRSDGNLPVVRALLEAGAPRNQRCFGRSVQDIVRQMDNRPLFPLLLDES